MYDQLRDLELTVEDLTAEARERETTSDFTRRTTVVALSGAGETGSGEDVTYAIEDHDSLDADLVGDRLAGTMTIEEFADRLEDIDLFCGTAPEQAIFRSFRRWGFESAALDLALRQADTTLAAVLGSSYDPVRFVVSTRLGDPPTGDRVLRWLERDPTLEFKLDPTGEWTAETVDRLVETGAVRTLDLKGQYEDTMVDQRADPALYSLVLEGFPDAIVEDAAVTDETRHLLAGETDRLSWDYPVRDVETIEALPWDPAWLNIKPSRFGSLQALLEAIEYCLESGIRLYGGGQFELDVGREHIQTLASLFYPDAPNDVAPSGYNLPEPPATLPSSPLEPPRNPRGLGWR